MPAKITKRLKALKLTELAKKPFFKEVEREIPELIKETIQKGSSPVAKGGKDGTSGRIRFEGYSDSYKKQISKGYHSDKGKKLRPVNLTLTGDMLRSLVAKAGMKSVRIFFRDSKAVYHNEKGAGKSKVIRRLLPRDGQDSFNPSITRKLREILVKQIRRFTKN